MTDPVALTRVTVLTEQTVLPKRYVRQSSTFLAEYLEVVEDRLAISEEIARYADLPASSFATLDDFFGELGD